MIKNSLAHEGLLGNPGNISVLSMLSPRTAGAPRVRAHLSHMQQLKRLLLLWATAPVAPWGWDHVHAWPGWRPCPAARAGVASAARCPFFLPSGTQALSLLPFLRLWNELNSYGLVSHFWQRMWDLLGETLCSAPSSSLMQSAQKPQGVSVQNRSRVRPCFPHLTARPSVAATQVLRSSRRMTRGRARDPAGTPPSLGGTPRVPGSSSLRTRGYFLARTDTGEVVLDEWIVSNGKVAPLPHFYVAFSQQFAVFG